MPICSQMRRMAEVAAEKARGSRSPPCDRVYPRSSLDDAVLAEISEIVHYSDLTEDKYGLPDSDGLYAYLSREVL